MLSTLFNFFFSFNDMPYDWQIRFQDPATPMAEGMIHFHNYIMFFLILIFFFVLWMLSAAVLKFRDNKQAYKFTHNSQLEIIWTIIPAIILIFIAFPSFTLLYSLEELLESSITIKIIGHQWYWEYAYTIENVKFPAEVRSFDSFLLPLENYKEMAGANRLLETDHHLFLPYNTHLRLIITSVDVLHSWAVPSFGIKLDACPGRLNQMPLFIKRPGLFYGQCSEICGINHAFMPISVVVLSPFKFALWLLPSKSLGYLVEAIDDFTLDELIAINSDLDHPVVRS